MYYLEGIAMNDTQKWYVSRGVWGGIIAASAGLASLFGYNLGADLQGDLVEWSVALAGVLGGALALIGRVKASKTIG